MHLRTRSDFETHEENMKIKVQENTVVDGRGLGRLQGTFFINHNIIDSRCSGEIRRMNDACDQLGMLVMEEAFDTWVQAKNDDDYHTMYARDWRR